ncbi:MAG TPA: lysylphosphatidylglycerol synthase domain-containing protein, partial [Solirubrobacteraceae bacterium]|nr:lysylphosphatidylglycerol synthase domain-containing protein [Solirubrobacteraceae bacterium]
MHRRIVVSILAAAAVAGFVLFVVPQIADLGPTLRRLRAGNPWWLGAGVALEAISLISYAALFHRVFSRNGGRIGWRSSFQITFAGDVATKLFASAGAGGIALTVWSLRASGLDPQTVASRMVAFEVMLYAVYVAALVVAGLGLAAGVFPGPAPSGLTLVPALVGLVVIALAVATPSQAGRWERRLQRRAGRSHGKAAQRWTRVA